MVEALTTDTNNLVCVQCWKTFERPAADVGFDTDAVDCPHCGASVPIPDEESFTGDVDLEDAIVEELPTGTEGVTSENVALGEDSFIEESMSDAGPDIEEPVEEAEDAPDDSEDLEEIEMIVEEEVEPEEEAAEPEEEAAEPEEEAAEPEEEAAEPEEKAAEPEEKAAEPEEKAAEPEEEAAVEEAAEASTDETSEGDDEDPTKLSDIPEDLDPEGVVWKLLIPGGLTYNFHGLQALMRWASGKRNLDEVAVSLDGMRWRNCGKVLALVDTGTPVDEALKNIPTLEEESSATAPEPVPVPSVSKQLIGATEDLLEAVNPTIELKGVTIPPPQNDQEAIMHEGGVASHIGDTRFGPGEIQKSRSDTVPAVTGQFTFQVETNYKNLAEGTKWAARILYTSVGAVAGLILGGALHKLGMWETIFKLLSP